MYKFSKILSIAIAMLFLLGLASTQDSQIVTAQTEDTTNYLYLDATYDPQTKTYSVAGLSGDQLKLLGLPQFTDEIWGIIGGFDMVELDINAEELSLKTDDKPLATIDWDAPSRELVYGLVDSYGVNMTSATKSRAEEWLGKANLIVNLRNSTERSKTLVIDLDTLLRVDIKENGRVAVEGFDVGAAVPPEITQLAATGNIENAALCLNKDVLYLQINGNNMPQIQVHQEGLEVVEKALKMNLGELEDYFKSQIGASISFDGTPHKDISCFDLH